MTLPALTLSVAIDRPCAEVANFLAHPMSYPRWASGLASGLTPVAGEPDVWLAQAPQGTARVRFCPTNALGVADHWVTLPDGRQVYVPLRVVANQAGCEVLLTLFRQPGVDDAQFEADAQWVRRDLATLKQVLEQG